MRALAEDIEATLQQTTARRDAASTIQALGNEHSEDADGLRVLLDELDVSTPGALADLLALVASSASYAALLWAAGAPTSQGATFDESAVRGAAWSRARWVAQEEVPASE